MVGVKSRESRCVQIPHMQNKRTKTLENHPVKGPEMDTRVDRLDFVVNTWRLVFEIIPGRGFHGSPYNPVGPKLRVGLRWIFRHSSDDSETVGCRFYFS